MWSNEQCLQLQHSLLEYQELGCPNGENIGGWITWKVNNKNI